MFKLIPNKADQAAMRRIYSNFLRGRVVDGINYRSTAYSDSKRDETAPVREVRMRPVPMTEEQRTEVLRRTGSKVFHERTFVRAR